MTNSELVVVGINDSHNASACIVTNGKLEAAIAEERIQRIKSTGGFPKNAIEACLTKCELKKSDVDYVVFGSKHVSPTNLHNYFPSLSVFDHIKVQSDYWYPILYEGQDIRLQDVLPEFKRVGEAYYPLGEIPFVENRELSQEDRDAIDAMRTSFTANWFDLAENRIIMIDHHTAHAYYGYFCNPMRKQGKPILALTSDAGGDGAYESVRVFNNGEVKSLHQGRTNLIASIYSYITLMLGMRPNEHEYKVMGLAAYAPEYHKKDTRAIFLDAVAVDGLQFKRSPNVTDLYTYFYHKLVGYRFDAIAGGLQDFVEELLTEWVCNSVEVSGVPDITFSGGLALNIKANKRFGELENVSSIFVAPGSGDESLPIGAAYAFLDDLNYSDNNNHNSWPRFNLFSIGTKASRDDIDELKNHSLIQGTYRINENAGPEDIAEILVNGDICALYNNNMEFGPRALGHRSIIADPSKWESATKINQAIKKRDFWMPFTPSILDERIDDYVINPKSLDCSYMTLAFDTTDLGKEHLLSALHPADLTARPQRVNAETSPEFYDIIKAFENLTGIGAVLNTSLNIHGKPIVMRPVEIADEILSSEGVELNYIYVQGILFSKDGAD